MVNDSLSFMKFVGLTLEDDVPDNTVLSRFRTELTLKDTYEKLMDTINLQLEEKGILLKKGTIVDASITDSPRKPRGKKEYQVVEDRKESIEAHGQEQGATAHTLLVAKVQRHVDIEAAWIKKAGKLRFGYKKLRWGYFLSALSKPMMAVFTFPFWIFSARTIDRLGKGIRTGARDAMLSDEATTQTKGTIFGFHRSLDTLGAVIGPLSALAFLYFYPGHYKALFYIAFIPGMVAIGFTFSIKNKNPIPKESRIKTSFFDFFSYWRGSPAQYRKLVLGLLLFTLVNSSDIFLLPKLKDAGLSDTVTIGTYIFYNLVYAAFAYPLGIIADRFGLKNIFLFGLALFAIVYFGMAFNKNLYLFFALFFLYGLYAATPLSV